MRIAVSSDLRAPLVDAVLKVLEARGDVVTYFGPTEPGAEEDWPVVSRAAALEVAGGLADEAILMCWTGTGACLVANKVAGVRAALCGDAETARGARKWNHANALALSIRCTTEALAGEILEAWFAEPFGTDDWNTRQIARVAVLDALRGSD